MYIYEVWKRKRQFGIALSPVREQRLAVNQTVQSELLGTDPTLSANWYHTGMITSHASIISVPLTFRTLSLSFHSCEKYSCRLPYSSN